MSAPSTLELLRREALEELVAATWARAPEAHRRELARLVRAIDRRLELAGDSPELLLSRRQNVAAALDLTPNGVPRNRRTGRATSGRARGPAPRVVRRVTAA